MKTKMYFLNSLIILVVLLAFGRVANAQNPLTDAQWQQRTKELASGLKKEWTEEWSSLNQNQPVITRSAGYVQADLMNAEYIPVLCFILDHDSYLKLTLESNLDYLIKLDTTRIDYVAFNKKILMQSSGIFKDRRWIDGGFGIYSQIEIDFISKLFAKSISLCKLRVSINPEHNFWSYYIFYDNGQLMCFRPDIPVPQPLLATLLAFRKNQEEMKQLMRQFGLE